MAGTVFLIPNTLGSEQTHHIIPVEVAEQAVKLRHFAVEEIRSARRFLRKIDREFPIDDSQFTVMNKRTAAPELMGLIRVLKAGEDVGILSEAGCPGIADPGSVLVALAHEHGIRVAPMVGPSSILLTLIGSGFNGQSFAFHGYLPKEQKERVRRLKDLEAKVRRTGETQLFMDTPFRNMHVLEDLLNELSDDALLCIASNLTLPDEQIRTRTVADWREHAYDLSKVPAMFALGKTM